MVVTALERMWDRKVRKGRGYRLPKPVISCNGIRDTSMAPGQVHLCHRPRVWPYNTADHSLHCMDQRREGVFHISSGSSCMNTSPDLGRASPFPCRHQGDPNSRFSPRVDLFLKWCSLHSHPLNVILNGRLE